MSSTARPRGSVTRIKMVPVATPIRSTVRSEPIHTEPPPDAVAKAAPPKSAGPGGGGMGRTRAKVTGSTW